MAMIQHHGAYASRNVYALCKTRSDMLPTLCENDDCGYCIDAPSHLPSGGVMRFDGYQRADGSICEPFFADTAYRGGDGIY